MAKKYLSTITGKKWELMEQLPASPLKDKLVELHDELVGIEQATNVFLTLARIEQQAECQTVTLSVNTLLSLSCEIETHLGGVFFRLNEILDLVIARTKTTEAEGK